MNRRNLPHYILLATIFALLSGLLVYPIWLTLRGGLATDPETGAGWTLEHVIYVFRDPTLRAGLLNAFLIAVVTTALSLLIGLPLAWLNARRQYPFKQFWGILVLAPLVLPPFVGAIGLRVILGRAGALNALFGADWDILGAARFWGVVIALALHLYPIIYLNASAALANLDPSLDEAGEALGAGGASRFFRITLPLIRPSLFAGSAIVFIWAFTELGTPLVFDFSTVTAVQIFNGVKEVNSSAQPFALCIVLLFFALLAYGLGKFAFGKAGYSASLRATRAAGAATGSRTDALIATSAFGLVTFLAIIPHIGVVLTSLTPPGAWYQTPLPTEWTLDNFELALGHPLARGSILTSLQLALWAVALDVVIGLAAGYLLARTKVRGRTLLDLLCMSPLAVPGLIMAFGYIAMTLRWPFGPGDPLEGMVDVVGSSPNPFPLLIAAYAVRRLPYIVRASVAGIEQVTIDLEQAATNLGASVWTMLRRILIPLITANLIAGGLLVFCFSMLEVSDSLMLAQREKHFPITKAILSFTERLGDGEAIASAMGVWGMLLLITGLGVASMALGKSMGSLFRA